MAGLTTALAAAILLGAFLFGLQYRAPLHANRQLSLQNEVLEVAYDAERDAKLTAEENLRANTVTVDFLMRLFRSPDPARDGRTAGRCECQPERRRWRGPRRRRRAARFPAAR